MKRWRIPTVLIAGLVATAGPVAAANAAPPSDVSDSGTLSDFCTFPVEYTLTGKSKVITKPDGQRIITSPGQRITLSANGNTVSYVITGTRFERDVVANGETTTEVEVKGRNILINSIATSERPGIFLVVGNFNFALDAAGDEVRVFDGRGQVTDVCEALS
ncbi:MAG: hypothetical protein ACQEXN_15315 [Actinomycetota bacterium]